MEFKKTSIKIFDDAPKEELIENVNYFSGSTHNLYNFSPSEITSTMSIPPEMPRTRVIPSIPPSDRNYLQEETNLFTNLREQTNRIRQLMYGRR